MPPRNVWGGLPRFRTLVCILVEVVVKYANGKMLLFLLLGRCTF